MAAKKKTGTSSSVDAAAKAIEKRYGAKYVNEGSRTLAQYSSSLRDVVAESPLYESYSKAALDAATKKVAQKQWVAYKAGFEDQRKLRQRKKK